MRHIFPRAIAGFRIFAASSVPSAPPAQIMVWISSMKRIVSFSSFDASSITCFSRPSNSPRYFVPATISDISTEIIRLSRIANGTSPRAIRRASHSTTAVFPTHGSPTRQGLFLVLRFNILISLSISPSRPVMGSILPSRASSVRSMPKKSRAGVLDSFHCCCLFCENGVCPFFGGILEASPSDLFAEKAHSSIFMISSIGPNIHPFSVFPVAPAPAMSVLISTTCVSKSFGETPTKSRI